MAEIYSKLLGAKTHSQKVYPVNYKGIVYVYLY